MLTVQVSGIEDINARLSTLDKRIARKVTSRALRAGGKMVQSAAQALCPEETGTLAKSIKVRAGQRRKGKVRIIVGAGKSWFTGPAFYGAFVEFGHKQGSRKLGDNRKMIPGKNFIKKAYDNTRQSALNAVISTYKSEIDRVIAEKNAAVGGE